MTNSTYYFNNLGKGWRLSLTGNNVANIILDPGVTYYLCFNASTLAECHMLFTANGAAPVAADLTPTTAGKAGVSTIMTDKDAYIVAPTVDAAGLKPQLNFLLDGMGVATVYLSRVSPAY
ncbi:MAG: hypothetical protein EKK57_11165 [Proteobacteria bacterium]|nr:MAG: hypothetical protein EKK57_11165 [Pseudomonadota bacterium]